MDELQVGDRLYSQAELNALPIGARIAIWRDARRRWTRTATGWEGRDPEPDVGRRPGSYYVFSYPNHLWTPSMGWSLRRQQWAFRDLILSGSEHHGTGAQDAAEAINTLHIEWENFPPGPGMRIESMQDKDRLPVGAIIQVARPEHWRSYGVFLRSTRQRWTHLLGPRTTLDASDRATVVSINGDRTVPAWLTEPPSENAAEEIHEFRRRAWREAMAAKKRHSWCGVIENVMMGFDLSADTVRPIVRHGDYAVGSMVHPEEALGLPIGTVLRWRARERPDARVAWFVRVGRSSNRAGTTLIFGYRNDGHPLGNYAKRMEIMHLPGVSLSLDVDVRHSWDYLPAGTVLTNDGGATEWVVARDHRASQVTGPVVLPYPNIGQHQLEAFGESTDLLRVVRFPRILRSGQMYPVTTTQDVEVQ